jgi:hypothetical protein
VKPRFPKSLTREFLLVDLVNNLDQLAEALVDARDIGEAAAKELLRREHSAIPLPREAYALVGPDVLTGPALAAIWAERLGRQVTYGGDDLDAFEQRFRAFIPSSRVYDVVMMMMMRHYQTDGAIATKAEIERLVGLLGHQPRSYRDFAKEMAAAWGNAQADLVPVGESPVVFRAGHRRCWRGGYRWSSRVQIVISVTSLNSECCPPKTKGQ